MKSKYSDSFIPFEKIKRIVIEKGFIRKTFNIDSEIKEIPKYIVSSDKKFWEFAQQIEEKAAKKSYKANYSKRDRHE
jgi:hypothetical protein